MPSVDVSGVSVNFPFEPYQCQMAYMEKMIQALRMGQNAILESPTGTGKTLCLLCSTLAWLEDKKAQICNQRWRLANSDAGPGESLNEYKNVLTSQLNSAAGAWEGELAPPKVIFASRTHSQLTQAIQELKRSAYRHFKVCVLGSREQLCIHPQVMKEESNSAKVHMCRAKVQARSCHFYNQLDAAKNNFSNQVLDIEDLVSLGTKHNCCPYYAARELKAEADIIFMPYNYLLDVKSRRAHGVELQGNIVIFDEAHNLERICEESASFDLTSADIAAAMREVSELSDKVLQWVKDEEAGGEAALNDSQMAISQDFNLKDLLQLKAILSDLETEIDNVQIPRPTEGLTKEGNFIFEILGKCNLTFETKIPILELVEKAVTHLTNEATSGIFHTKGAGLSKFADVIKLVFSREPDNNSLTASFAKHQEKLAQYYKVHIRQEEPKKSKRSEGWGAVASTNKQGRVLSYWCFSPGHAMEDLKAHGVRNVILTSGTLSPLSSFKTEMGISFQVELENPHVIEKHQVWVGTVGKGPDGTMLNSSYEHRFKESYQSSLGNAIVNFARVVPNGLLLFFPSYVVMDKCLEHWQSAGIWSRVEQYKPIFVEPRHKAEFHTAIINFYEKINDPTLNGAIFAAVCRGKVSEGLDFADNNGRAVVITGLPFPPRMDPRVVLKMQFLDQQRAKKREGLSGQEWYRQQATRAVNQAIGRVIRHKQDFGAILLCDNRFSTPRAHNDLPIWVRAVTKDYNAFGIAIKDLMGFFKTAEKMLPAPGPPKNKVSAAARGGGAYFMPTVSRTRTADMGQVVKASTILDHVPSLRKRQGGEGMSLAKLRVEYEASTPEANRSTGRSARGLLDALNMDDKRGSSRDDQLGESQVPSYQEQLRASQSQLKAGKKKIIIKKTGSATDVKKDNLQTAESYLSEVKQTLSSENYQYFSKTLVEYKKTGDFEKMVNCLAEIFIVNVHSNHLFRRFYKFLRPQHKEQFDAKCRELLGQSCGYQSKSSSCSSSSSSAGGSKKRPAVPRPPEAAVREGDSSNKRVKVDSDKTVSMDIKSTAKSTATSVGARHHLDALSQLPGLPSGFHPSVTSTPAAAISKPATTSIPFSSFTSCSSTASVSAKHMTASSSISVTGPLTGPTDPTVQPLKLPDSASSSFQTASDNCTLETVPEAERTGSKLEKEKENNGGGNPQPEPTGSAASAKLNKVYVHAETDMGVDCVRCKQPAKIPFKAPCSHICCVACWKEAISATKSCPKCGAKVKRKNLSQVCFVSSR